MSYNRNVLTFWQAKARTDADRIINGEQTATVEQLNRIVTTLQSTDSYVRQTAGSDYQRVRRLRDIRDKKIFK